MKIKNDNDVSIDVVQLKRSNNKYYASTYMYIYIYIKHGISIL